MGIVKQEKVACFDPFKMDCFVCPNCNSTDFVDLIPYGGIWCSGCNLQFVLRSTCDGIKKIVVQGFTEHCHRPEDRKLASFGAVIWKDDDSIRWMKFTHTGNIVR